MVVLLYYGMLTIEGVHVTTVQDPQRYIDDMARKRGYVLDYHKVMAKQDFEVLQAANGLVGATYLDQRALDRKTKELIFIVSLTVMRASHQGRARPGCDAAGDPRGDRDQPARGRHRRVSDWLRGLV